MSPAVQTFVTAQLCNGALLLTDVTLAEAQGEDVVNSLLFAQLSADAAASRSDPGGMWADRVLSILTDIGWTRGSDQIQEKIFTQDTVNSTFSPADAIIVNMGPLVGATAAAVLGDAFTAIERDGKFAGIWGAKTVLDRTAGALVCFCSEDGGTPIIFYNYSGLVGSTPLCGYPHESYSVSDLTKFTQRQGRLDLNAALYATVRDKVAARVAPYQPSTVQEFPLSLRRLLAMEEAGEISWIQN